MKKKTNYLFACITTTLLMHNLSGIQERPHFLSFIIPCYNRAHTIRQAIDSTYQQNLDLPFEVICVDDGSTDKTHDVLQGYQQKYPNFHFYVHEKNLGASEARNTAIAHAQGNLIFNLDSDNILEPNSVQKLIELLDEMGVEVAAFEKIQFFTGNKVKKHSWGYLRRKKETFDLIDLFTRGEPSPISSGNYLFTKKSYERAGGYSGRIRETWIFGFRQLATGVKIAILPNSFYWHRLSSDSKWMQYEKKHLNEKTHLEAVKQFPELFTQETNNLFSTYDVQRQNFSRDLRKGLFKLIPEKALEHLLNGYKFEYDEKYELALEGYTQAITEGCYHEKIHKKVEELKNSLC